MNLKILTWYFTACFILASGACASQLTGDAKEHAARQVLNSWAQSLRTNKTILFSSASVGTKGVGASPDVQSLRFQLEKSAWNWPTLYRVDRATLLRPISDSSGSIPDENDWNKAIERSATSLDEQGTQMNFGGFRETVERFANSNEWAEEALQSSFRSPWHAAQWICSQPPDSGLIATTDFSEREATFLLNGELILHLQNKGKEWQCDTISALDRKSRVIWQCEFQDYRNIDNLKGQLPFWRAESRPSASGIDTLARGSSDSIELGVPVHHAMLRIELEPKLQESFFTLSDDEAKNAAKESRKIWRAEMNRIHANQTIAQKDRTSTTDSADSISNPKTTPDSHPNISQRPSAVEAPSLSNGYRWLLAVVAISISTILFYFARRNSNPR